MTNETFWGPHQAAVSESAEKSTEIRFYGGFKSEKLGKIADWIGLENKARYRNYDATERDDTFISVVDNRSGNPTRKSYRPQAKSEKNKERKTNDAASRAAALKKKWNSYRKGDKKDKKYLNIDEKWKLLDTFDIDRLSKLHAEYVQPENLMDVGKLKFYDASFDKIYSKAEKPLEKSSRKFKKVSLDKDRNMEKAVAGIPNKGEKTIVVASDTVLCALMSASKSFLPWDFVVKKTGNIIYLDSREESLIECVTAVERPNNAPEFGNDAINQPSALVDEATAINLNFMEQATRDSEKLYDFGGASALDWLDANRHALIAYRYRKWEIDAGIDLVGRIQIDAAAVSETDDSKISLLNLKCLNEIDPRATGMDWRQKIDSQKSAIFTTEFSNNTNKMSKWTFQAILGSVDVIKMGFASRLITKDNSKHVILGTHPYIPMELAKQMNIDIRNGWGIVKTFIKYFSQLEDGTYFLCKDPDLSKKSLRLYDCCGFEVKL